MELWFFRALFLSLLLNFPLVVAPAHDLEHPDRAGRQTLVTGGMGTRRTSFISGPIAFPKALTLPTASKVSTCAPANKAVCTSVLMVIMAR